jgi:hypothetical protein
MESRRVELILLAAPRQAGGNGGAAVAYNVPLAVAAGLALPRRTPCLSS